MPNLTYTAQGHFTNNRKMNLTICIPSEPTTGAYVVQLYNLSKKTKNGNINAVFCFFSDGTDHPIEHDKFDYRLNFDLDAIKNYDYAIDFDANAAEALFLFFHEKQFDEKDLEKYFTDLEKLYDRIKRDGNQSEDGFLKPSFGPRKIGTSLVIKMKGN
ncbi:hypothetical protein [Flavobacterium sp.]|uniref:hypothetical protein n=1 Tax=Flavobacterium sp. TaxID=239 RepID=UPI002623F03F|nr:hypothetical protein [Flavobacterium sp.]MDD3005334.1 hypothetical protein [Flavobacterium sp.]